MSTFATRIAAVETPAVNDTTRKDRRYIAAWAPGVQIHTEIVCLAEGIAEPVVWSFHGMTGRDLQRPLRSPRGLRADRRL